MFRIVLAARTSRRRHLFGGRVSSRTKQQFFRLPCFGVGLIFFLLSITRQADWKIKKRKVKKVFLFYVYHAHLSVLGQTKFSQEAVTHCDSLSRICLRSLLIQLSLSVATRPSGLRLNHRKILFKHRALYLGPNRYTSKSKNKICIIISSVGFKEFFLRAFCYLFYCVYVDSLLTFPFAHLRLAISRNCKLYSYHERALRLGCYRSLESLNLDKSILWRKRIIMIHFSFSLAPLSPT